jgi:hypothetical protein
MNKGRFIFDYLTFNYRRFISESLNMNYARFISRLSANRQPSTIRELTRILQTASPEMIALSGSQSVKITNNPILTNHYNNTTS